MTQPPAGSPDPYQHDPYQPGGSPSADAYAPPAPSGAPDGAAQQASGWGEPAGQQGQAPYGAAPAYGAQPYGTDGAAQQPYAAPYGGAPDPTQQGYGAQPYGVPDPTQQPPYGAPYGGYPGYGPPAPSSTNTLAITGFVLAIVGLLGCWIPGLNIFAAILGLAGLVLGIVGLLQVKNGKTGKGFALSAIVVGALAILGTVLTYVLLVAWADSVSTEYEQTLSEIESESQQDLDRMSGDATEDILANDLGVEFGTFEGTADEYGWVESSLSVTLTNNADEAMMYDLDVDAVAADGTVIESDFAFTETLEPGATETVEIFDFIDAENLEAMKTATFEVTSVSQY